MEKGHITPGQMALILYVVVIATATLTAPGLTGIYAGRDMWLSIVWASLTGFVAVWLAVRLHRIYPEESFIQYTPRILGTFFGKGLGLLYLLFYLYMVGFILREYAEFVKSVFLTQTPIVIIIGSLMLVCALAAQGGIEVIARVSQILLPAGLLMFCIILLLTAQAWDVQQLFPVLEHGIQPSLKGGIVSSSWFSQLFVMVFLLPSLSDRKKGLKWGWISVVGALITLVGINMIGLFVFGMEFQIMTYLLFEASRYISYGQFLEHIDAFMLILWIIGIFIKVVLVHYGVVLGTAQWLNLSDFRPLSLPIGLIAVLFSIWVAPDYQKLVQPLTTFLPLYNYLISVLIPALLLMFARWRNRQRSQREVNLQ